MKKIFFSVLFILFSISLLDLDNGISAKPDGFYLEELPSGSEVTLPHPATTYVSMKNSVTLTATDTPQTLKLSPTNIDGSLAAALKIAIYDKNQVRVKYVILKPNTPFLYSFKNLGSVMIIPELTAVSPKEISLFRGMRLQIESDKPLSIKR